MSDVVFTFSFETFDDAVDREFCRPPDQVLRSLARDRRVGRLVSADPWRSRPIDVLRRRGPDVTTCRVVGRDVVRVRPRRWRCHDPRDPSRLASEAAAYGRRIGQLADVDDAALVTCNPFMAAWAEGSWIGRRVYFGRDDWLAYPPKAPWRRAMAAAYRDLATRCDAVIVVSDELAQRFARDDVVVVPNGVDAERWHHRHPRPELLGDLTDYAVYAGTVDARIDVAAVQAVIRAEPALPVLVAGPVEGPTGGALKALPAVRLLGRLVQDELVGLLQHANLGLLPHVADRLTTAMSPLKLYEYLAAGLPVIARDLPPIRGVDDDRVVRCGDADAFEAGTRKARALAPLPESERQAVVAGLSWTRRLEPLNDAVVGQA